MSSYYQQVKQVDSLIRQYTEENAITISSLIDKDKDLEIYFLREIKSIEWFEWFDRKEYFNPVKRLKRDNDGNVLFWEILPYLERVSTQCEQKVEIANTIIKIVQNTVNLSIKEEISNYHIWWYFVKILNNIPTELIVANKVTVEQFKTWLSEWLSLGLRDNLVISDIAKGLLPKFLEHKDTVRFAEAIIEIITEIKKSGRKDSLTKKEDVVLAHSSHWILDAFRKHSPKIGEVCAINIIYDLANKLRTAIEYKQDNSRVDIKLKNDIYQIRVNRIEKGNLKAGELGFKEDCYKVGIKQFDKEQIKGIDIEKEFWAFYRIEPNIEICSFEIIEAIDKEIFKAKIKNNLPATVNWQEAEDLDKKIENLFNALFEDYSQVWCPSVSDGPEFAEGAEEALTLILRDVLRYKCEINKDEGRQILKGFLSDNYRFPIFKKSVLYFIDTFWADYKDLFDKALNTIPDILDEADYEVELQDLLKNHNTDFGEPMKLRLKELIDNVPEYYRKEGKKHTAYWKHKWLSPLKDNLYFSDYYNQEKQKAEAQESYTARRSALYEPVVHTSSLSKEEILSMPNIDLVRYLIEYKGADSREEVFAGKSDKRGLGEALYTAVKENPMKFAKELELFDNAPYLYVHNILRGFKDAWNSDKELLWQKTFDFCLRYVQKPSFLQEALAAQGEDSGGGKYLWVVEVIAELVEDGCKNDARAFNPEHFDTVKQIFKAIVSLPKSEKRPDTERDALTYALNTTFGRIIMSFIVFSLRVSRATKQKEQDWGKKNYEQFFDKGIEAYIWFGRYLPNIRYLDEKYVNEIKIPELTKLPADNYEWQKFMEGYLTGSSIYIDIYNLMRPNYVKTLEKKIFPEDVDNRLVQHITIGYLAGCEELKEKNKDGEDSLFLKMLDDAGTPQKHNRWLEVVGYFWTKSGRTIRKDEREEDAILQGEKRDRILEFWKWSCDNQDFVKDKLGKDHGAFLSRMSLLTILLDRIDETTQQWLMLSAPYVDEEYYSSFFMEYLTKFEDDDSVERMAKIFLKVLENTTPTFKQEDIQLIVERLYKLWLKDKARHNKVKEDADSICNTYGRRGIHFLKDIWAKYNS